MIEKGTSQYTSDSIGYLAYQAVHEEASARVVGSMSRGVFLLTPRKRIVFISNQSYRSPLTITVPGLAGNIEAVVPGMPVEVAPDRIEIPEAWFAVSLATGSPWSPPLPPVISGRLAGYRSHLEETLIQITHDREALGFSFLLWPLLNHLEPDNLSPEQASVFSHVRRLEKALYQQDPAGTLEIFNFLLGRGRGLTPSGDDLVMGLLLALNRWPGVCRPVPNLAQLNQLAVQSAYLRTTAISANLIECATYRHSDERLLSALDGIVTGQLSGRECAENLLGLGSSSGIDALAGITVALNP